MKSRLRKARKALFFFVLMATLGAVKDWYLLGDALNRVEDALLVKARYDNGYLLSRMVDQIKARRKHAQDHPIDWSKFR